MQPRNEEKLDPTLVEIVSKGVKKRREGKDTEFLFGAERVDLEYDDKLRFLGKKGSHSFIVDEPSDRGGTDGGLNPLALFLAGSASCLMMQYVRLSITDGVRLDDFRVSARAHFDRRIRGAFTEMIYDIHIQSKSSNSEITALSEEAERFCYAHNTLAQAGVKMQTNLYHNGQQIR